MSEAATKKHLEEFERNINKSGALKIIEEVLAGLYDEPDKSESDRKSGETIIESIRMGMGGTDQTNQALMDEDQKEILIAENEELRK